MYQFAAVQQTSTAKLHAFFQRFKTEVGALKVNETKITTENAFNRGHFGTEDNNESKTMNQITTKNCFCYFCRFATCTLTLGPQNTYIYVF